MQDKEQSRTVCRTAKGLVKERVGYPSFQSWPLFPGSHSWQGSVMDMRLKRVGKRGSVRVKCKTKCRAQVLAGNVKRLLRKGEGCQKLSIVATSA